MASVFDGYDMAEIDKMAANIAFAFGLRWGPDMNSIGGFREQEVFVNAHTFRLAAISARRVALPAPDEDPLK